MADNQSRRAFNIPVPSAQYHGVLEEEENG
jgi:hypothetical protein